MNKWHWERILGCRLGSFSREIIQSCTVALEYVSFKYGSGQYYKPLQVMGLWGHLRIVQIENTKLAFFFFFWAHSELWAPAREWGGGVYSSNVTFSYHALCSFSPNLVPFLWLLPWMPELKPELPSCTSPFQVVSVNSSSSSTVAWCFCFLLKQNLSEELCLPHLYVLTSCSLLSRLQSGCRTHPPGGGHQILPLVALTHLTLPPSETLSCLGSSTHHSSSSLLPC